MAKLKTESTTESTLEIPITELSNKLLYLVKNAHRVCDKTGAFLYRKALDYPQNYKVTTKQWESAKNEYNKRRDEFKEKHKGDLVFVGMGMDFSSEKKFIGNHRIRTEFLNKHGKRFFLEIGTGTTNKTFRVDFAIDRDLQVKYKDDYKKQGEFYNYKGLERMDRDKQPEYSYSNVLKFVNSHFDCEFKKLVVDSFFSSPSSLLCVA